MTTATTMEMRAACSAFGSPIPEEGQYVALNHKGAAISLLVTGIGPLNAGIVLAHHLGGRSRPLGVCNLGIAGAFDLQDLPLGQAVAVQAEIWPEYGLVTDEGIDPKGIGLALGRLQGRSVWNRLDLDPESAATEMHLSLPDIPRINSLTVAGVSGSTSRAEAFRRAHPSAGIENMEGFALAWTCFRFSIPFLEVRTVSNRVGSRRAEHWDMQLALGRLGQIAPILLKTYHGP